MFALVSENAVTQNYNLFSFRSVCQRHRQVTTGNELLEKNCDDQILYRGFFSTGTLTLDVALGGGWPKGRIVEVILQGRPLRLAKFISVLPYPSYLSALVLPKPNLEPHSCSHSPCETALFGYLWCDNQFLSPRQSIGPT